MAETALNLGLNMTFGFYRRLQFGSAVRLAGRIGA
jgi:hypothetical protein